MDLAREMHLTVRCGSSSDSLVREAVNAVAERVLSGHFHIEASEAELLMQARGVALIGLLTAAGCTRDEGLRRAGREGVITYSRKVFIPLTRLCRDRCHYCVFVKTPGSLHRDGVAPYMTAEEVLAVARDGADQGCKEALLTLGDRPESRWPEARTWLREHGYDTTLDYVGDMAQLVLDDTGLLPHLNPGVMSWVEMQRLRPVAPSMGLMLEAAATRLWSEPGGPHFGSPDKEPSVRLQVLEDAGRSRIPFTTGVLFGLGETYAERVEALVALREAHERYGHLQEVIVQNFRAKPRTAMAATSDLATDDYVASVAVARLLLGPDMRVQAPPNLTDPRELGLLLRAGVDDWGGVSPLTPDHVNPERPWPHVGQLAAFSREEGFQLRERLTVHPSYVRQARANGDWIDDRLLDRVLALADDYGLARDDRVQGVTPTAVASRSAGSAGFARLLEKAAADPAGLGDEEYVELLHADGSDLEELAALADAVRCSEVGAAITFAVNRNLDSSVALDHGRLGELVREAVALGATEICAQGAVPVEAGAAGYLDFAQAVKSAAPQIHLHAFRPVEARDGAQRAGMGLDAWLRQMRAAGVDTMPGTGARILDDGIRAILTCGTDISSSAWLQTVTAAHMAGLRTTATMLYGHVETPVDQVRHLRALIRIQDLTNGFTEFIPMPWLPVESAVPVPGARPGPTLRESRAVHAVSRLMLHGRIPHVQAAWTKLGLRGAQLVLAGGADDLGGLLLDGAIDRSAGQEAGRRLGRDDILRLADQLRRPVRQRTTTYADAADARHGG